jgi:hypothetical protein
MSINNAIANFGLQTGQNTQRTVMNALAQRENRNRYEDQRNMLMEDRENKLRMQEEAKAQALDQQETEFGANYAKTYWSAPAEQRPQIMKAFASDAMARGYMSPQDSGMIDEGYMYKLAGASGLNIDSKTAQGLSDWQRKQALQRKMLSDEDQLKALRIEAGLDPRAVGSAPITMVNSPDPALANKVAGLEAQLAKSKQDAKNRSDLNYKPSISGAVTTAQEDARRQAEETKNASNSTKMLRETESSFESLAASDLDLIYGRGESVMPDLLRTQAGIDLIAQRDQYLANLRLAQVGKLAGTGPITESEQAILKQAATVLNNPDISPELAQRALIESRQIIMNAVKRNSGGPAQSRGVNSNAPTSRNADPLGLGL